MWCAENWREKNNYLNEFYLRIVLQRKKILSIGKKSCHGIASVAAFFRFDDYYLAFIEWHLIEGCLSRNDNKKENGNTTKEVEKYAICT